MGRIMHRPDGPTAGHRHEEPPPAVDHPYGTVWECSCGLRRQLERPTWRDALDDPHGVWVWQARR